MDRTQKALCRARLGSAFRTALACTIVGCATLYGPAHLRHELAFPAFSYLTTILIVPDATLGDTLQSLWHVICATMQVMPFAITSLWLIGPARFNAGIAAAMVAIGAFAVGLPKSTHLTCKRIAFGQIVVVYVGVVIHGAKAGVVMHPLHVAACTALGALASVLALLLPYPRLAYFEVRKACRMYAENASERLGVFIKAFSAQDNPTALDLISQAKPFSETGAKLIHSINLMQEGMLWERPQIRFLKPSCMKLGERLQNMETPVRGMELALTSCPSIPASMADSGLRDTLVAMEAQIGLKLEQAKCSLPFDYSMTAPETKGELLDNSIQILTANSPSHEDLSAIFFLFCVKLLQEDSVISLDPESRLENSQKARMEETRDSTKQGKCDGGFRMIGNCWKAVLKSERLLFAFKCSLSLGLAVLFGLIYNTENGYWSGLTIAISFVTGRQATFTVANARAQGTVMGSVYGLLGCFIIQRYAETRFILLFPWIIFTTFLKHSQMYGQSGGISAVIGALLILGREDYGPPSVFAIARITEAFIGLSCFIMVEFLLQPARAATLAKYQLSHSLQTLGECVKEISLSVCENDSPRSTSMALSEKQKILKLHVKELERFIGEAQLGPNFWFMPFRDSCYNELLKSLLKMVDLLVFVAYDMEFISQVSNSSGVDWTELLGHVNHDLELFKERVGSALKFLEEVTLIKSLAVLEKELQRMKNSHDIELGRVPDVDAFKLLSTDEEVVGIILSSFLRHAKEANDKIHASEGEQEQKSQMVLCLSSLGFCISSLMKGTIEIEKQVKELFKWENPSSHINFREISCKINTLCIYKSGSIAS